MRICSALIVVIALCSIQVVAQEAGTGIPQDYVDTLKWRSLGPANMGGRIIALAVNPQDTTMWWAATASGGLLKTTNNGISFEHQFDQESTVSIGHVAVSASDPKVLWIGTGEANPRNSVSWGDGVYKSTDGGKTWKNMGLKESFQIGRIAIHPTNPDIVYVGALGRLWGASEQRGLYKTTDGGTTWKRILHVDDKTGVMDIDMHPTSPDTLLVATYERQRDGFDGNDPVKKFGEGSGLWRTTNGGKSWDKVTKGLPSCTLGRIGVDWYRKDPNVVFMVLESEKIGMEPEDAPYMGITGESADVGTRLTSITEKGPAEKAGLKEKDIILAVDGVRIQSYDDFTATMRKHKAGDKLSLEVSRDRKGMELVFELGKRPKARRGGEKPFGGRLGGQRENIQDQQGQMGYEYGGVYRSADGGVSWERVNSCNPRPMYFSQIAVDPSDETYVYLAGVSLYRSKDGGRTFTSDGGRGVHADQHAFWVDPANGRHIILGNDGGIYVTYDRMEKWDHLNHVAIGQFYHVGVGPRRDYKVYGGLQDNGSWGGPNRASDGSGPINQDWIRIGGGDGFTCLVDPNDPDVIYYQSQNGSNSRTNLRSGERGSARPSGGRSRGRGRPGAQSGSGGGGRRPARPSYRFNWDTPFILSNHNSRIYYSAGNYVFRSLDRGNRLKKISPEITMTDKGSGSALAESPVDPDVLYVGTTDGGFWMTRDGGATWAELYDQGAVAGLKSGVQQERPVAQNSEGGERAASTGGADEKKEPKPASKTSEKDDISKKALSAIMPERRWVSSIQTSRYEAGRCYVVFDGHRSDDDEPYVFATEDHGVTWRSIRANLPSTAGSTRVIAEDIVNKNILYLGCEFSCWVSTNRGKSWTRFNSNLPTVAVHDFAQHKTCGDLVVATHGRSLWVMDVTPLRQMTDVTMSSKSHLYKPNDVVVWKSQPRRGNTNRVFTGSNPTSGAELFFSLSEKPEKFYLSICGLDGKSIREFEVEPKTGLNRVAWDLRMQAPPQRNSARQGRPGGGPPGGSGFSRFGRNARRGRAVGAGTYIAVLEVDGDVFEEKFEVQLDPGHPDGIWRGFELDEEESEEHGPDVPVIRE